MRYLVQMCGGRMSLAYFCTSSRLDDPFQNGDSPLPLENHPPSLPTGTVRLNKTEQVQFPIDGR